MTKWSVGALVEADSADWRFGGRGRELEGVGLEG